MRLVQSVNGIKTLTVFDSDSLYFEKSTGINSDACLAMDPILFAQSTTLQQYSGYSVDIDYQMAVGLGVKFETNRLFGLPERESSPVIKNTQQTDPYRFFNIDYYMHQRDDATGEYGSIPYVTGHAVNHDAAVLWVNSADTWVDVAPLSNNTSFTGFVSESGVLELFLLASATSPKRILKDLATITGHA